MNKRPFSFSGIVLVLIFLFTSGCMAKNQGTIAWIDVPINHLLLPEPKTLQIEGHASSPGGIARVEISINGTLLTAIDKLAREGDLVSFETSWSPGGIGSYTVQVIAIGKNGTSSQADTALVTIGTEPATEPPTEVPTPTFTPSETASLAPTDTDTPVPTNTDTPTIPPPQETTIEFWADPPMVTAGKCSDLHWKVTNALKVVFGGTERSLEGWDSVCTCEAQNYPLTVTHLDGQEERVFVKVEVTGTCQAADKTPPPVPTQVVPGNGLSIACKATQSLAWLPVTDPSGIGEYQVLLERSSDNANWVTAPGSPIEHLTDKATQVNTECGWYYRWRVRAIDTAGNASNWSGWFYFSITLS